MLTRYTPELRDDFSPFTEFNRLHNLLNRVVGPQANRLDGGYPAINEYANQEEVVLTAEIPGVSPEDVDLSVHGTNLILKATRKAPETGEKDRFLKKERGYGSFSRTIPLPFRVDADKVSAELRHGILRITLPRVEADKPKRISLSHS